MNAKKYYGDLLFSFFLYSASAPLPLSPPPPPSFLFLIFSHSVDKVRNARRISDAEGGRGGMGREVGREEGVKEID